MGKWQNDDMLDAALSYIKTNSAKLVLCESQPADFAAANDNAGTGTGVALATTTLVSADFTGGSSSDGITDGVSGRKLIVPEKENVDVDISDDATHVAIISGTELLYVTTCSTQAVTATSQVTIPSWDIEIRDVTQ